MRTAVLLMGVSLALASGTPPELEAQPLPGVGPPIAEIEAAWTGIWNRLLQGDVAGARRYVHSSRRHLFPGNRTPAELQDLARQMTFCQVDPTPLPIDLDEVMYRVRCERGDEKAETLVGLRRDVDGVWRFVTI